MEISLLVDLSTAIGTSSGVGTLLGIALVGAFLAGFLTARRQANAETE